MQRVFCRASVGAALVVGALGPLMACSNKETGLCIGGNVKREAPQGAAGADANRAVIGEGALDVALRLDYSASLLVGSQLTPRGDKANLRTETAITTIKGAEVQLYTDTGGLDTEFTVPASGVISPSNSTDPGFGIIDATLIPAERGVALAGELTSRNEVRTRVAQVKVFGETIGGVEVESAEMTYVIRVCEGCLIDFPPAALQGNACSRSLDQNPDVPCRVGQDDLVDCRVCTAYNPYCQTTDEVAQ